MRVAAGSSPSILLILPFFGRLPTYAGLFFKSCAANPSINWLLVTDQRIDETGLPPNVRARETTLQALKTSIESVLGMDTALSTPYKLCDFKPAYGVIFSEDVAGFDFWGHCDMDVVFGDVRAFITPDILERYKKVLIHGHLSLYRNCYEANHFFQLEAPGVTFRDACASPKVRSFSEFRGIRLLLDHHRIPFFRDDNYLADIDRNVHRLTTIQPPNYRHQCFYWERGRLFKAFLDGKKIGRQEYMYIHLQKRAMTPPPQDVIGSDSWYITPSGFERRESDPVSAADLDRLNPSNVLFDWKRFLYSSLWRVKWSVSQVVDPWPRRV